MNNGEQIILNPLGKRQGIFYLRLVVVALFFSLSFYAQPKLQVTDAKKNFGFVKKGEVVKNEYEITNTGNAPLLITAAEVECSCTTVNFPKEPVLPGQKVTVTAAFDTKSAYGRQDRFVILRSNDPAGTTRLRFKGIVSNK